MKIRAERRLASGRTPHPSFAKATGFPVFKMFPIIRGNTLVFVALLDLAQILYLAIAPAPAGTWSLEMAIPPPSFNAFAHVFLGNEFVGVQELIPIYSTFAFARSLYLLVPSMAFLGALWHATRTEVLLKLFSFAYSWIEVSAYSYSVVKSFGFLVKLVKERTVNPKAVVTIWAVMTMGLAIAALLEVMALNVL